MSTCRLCFPPKVTTWHEATKDHIIMDCPACGETLIVFRGHGDRRGEKDAKKIATSFFGHPAEIVERDCFSTNHPHFHVRRTEKKKRVHEEDAYIPPY